MLYDYRQESKTPMLLTLANGNTIEGEFIDLRIETDTLPKGKLWYHIRHTDDDWTEPASLKNGCVVVNFCGTFICDPINDFPSPLHQGSLRRQVGQCVVQRTQSVQIPLVGPDFMAYDGQVQHLDEMRDIQAGHAHILVVGGGSLHLTGIALGIIRLRGLELGQEVAYGRQGLEGHHGVVGVICVVFRRQGFQ